MYILYAESGANIKAARKKEKRIRWVFFFFFWFGSSSEPVSEADKVRRRICDHVTGNVEKDRRQHYFMSVGHVHLIT